MQSDADSICGWVSSEDFASISSAMATRGGLACVTPGL